MNVKKAGNKPIRKSGRVVKARSAGRKLVGIDPQVKRLRKELAVVKRERDSYLHEIYKQLQRETEAMNLNMGELRSLIGKGMSSDDLLAKLAAKKRA